MASSSRFLSPSEAAARLGVSAKALRLYEQRGLVAPGRTAAGWRAYAPEHMAQATEIAALRTLGLSLAQVARVLKGHADALEAALAAHQAALEGEMRALADRLGKVRTMRADLARGQTPAASALANLLARSAKLSVAFELPWPWGGEYFELNDIAPLTYIIGPLGSGKTRLAMRLAEALPGGVFLGLDRLANNGADSRARCAADPALGSRVDGILNWLTDEGATASDALFAMIAALEDEGPAALIVDMVEQGLDHATQEALGAHLRLRVQAGGRPLFVLTRSSAILDLTAVGADEAIMLCPANHSPPTRVAPYPGASGYEAVATCLASPDVRARTEGIIAWHPEVA